MEICRNVKIIEGILGSQYNEINHEDFMSIESLFNSESVIDNSQVTQQPDADSDIVTSGESPEQVELVTDSTGKTNGGDKSVVLYRRKT